MSDEIKKLLELAKLQTTKEVTKKKRNIEVSTQVLKFIKELNIQEGDVQIPNAFVYFYYYKWRKPYKLLNKDSFFKQFSQIFKKYLKPYERGYYLNPLPFDLTEKGHQELVEYERNQRRFQKKIETERQNKARKNQSQAAESE